MKKIFFISLLTGLLIIMSLTATQSADWWDKFGKPQYGGKIIFSPARFHVCLDAYSMTDYGACPYFLEGLWIPNWTLDRETWPFTGPFIPEAYLQGNLAESWEIKDLQTLIVHIRQGIHWQDKEPVNGREFTAHDVEYHYDRFLGTGNGFTKPSARHIARMGVTEKVTATDKYTVVFKFKNPSVLNFNEPMEQDSRNSIEAPEVVQKYGDTTDWKNAVGTGPWILTDFVVGSSFTFNRNPNYWGYDERHPENRLPYADTFKILYISDVATRVAALRTRKVDFTDELGMQQAGVLAQSNPELLQAKLPYISSNGIYYRMDQEPFNDLNVRKALQMAIDRKAIADSYYSGSVNGIPCGMVIPSFQGYCYPYREWPQELKDEYGYNPEKARKLLAEAGYPDGFETSILVSNTDDLAVVEIIKSYFNDIGITLNIDARDQVTTRSLSSTFTYKMFWGRNTGSTANPSQVATMPYSSHAQNFCQANDPVFDGMCDEMNNTTDRDAVKPLTARLDQYVIEQHWGIRLFPVVTYNIWQPYVKGYSGESLLRMGNPGGWLWARFWIDKNLKD